VAHEVADAELRDHFHDGEKIKVTKVRVVLHRDSGNVKMGFVDFDDAASLRNALMLQVLSLVCRTGVLAVRASPDTTAPRYGAPLGC
jgi:hypothetical protein